MIPIRQTNPGGRGNCMAACWASILEVPIGTVPDYRAIEAGGGSWMNAVNTWLTKHFGLMYYELEPYVAAAVLPLDWHLINYGTREFGHAVVGYCGRPVWDPMGRTIRGGRRTAEPYNYGILCELTDELKATWQPTWDECLCGLCIRGEG